MHNMNKLFQRKPIHLLDYDYQQNNYYFITICTKDRTNFFGQISATGLMLNDIGEIIKNELLQLTEQPQVNICAYVIMPNHIHFIVNLREKNVDEKPRGINNFISKFKSITTIKVNKKNNTGGVKLWQRRYYEHVIRNENDYLRILTYIENNPQNWREDNEYKE